MTRCTHCDDDLSSRVLCVICVLTFEEMLKDIVLIRGGPRTRDANVSNAGILVENIRISVHPCTRSFNINTLTFSCRFLPSASVSRCFNIIVRTISINYYHRKINTFKRITIYVRVGILMSRTHIF